MDDNFCFAYLQASENIFFLYMILLILLKKGVTDYTFCVYIDMKHPSNITQRFMLNIENDTIEELVEIARKNGVTVSWILRAILSALHKKYKKKIHDLENIKRPPKFTKYYSIFPLYLYGDKEKWKNIARLWQVELGPLIRFGIEEFLNGVLIVDLETVKSIKAVKNMDQGHFRKLKLSKRGIYISLNKASFYLMPEYWKKNEKNNLKLMNRGISSRRKPRKIGFIN